MSNLERKGKDATQCRKTQSDVFPQRPAMQGNNHEKSRVRKCGQHHSTSSPCSQIIPNPQRDLISSFSSTLLQEVKPFDYLGPRLDPMMNMKAAVASILEKANKGHSLTLAVSYSLRYDKHHSTPTFCSLPVEMLNLWKSYVLPHFLLYLHYISDASQVQTLQTALNRSLSTTLHVYGHPTALLADTGIPPLYITQSLQLAQFRFRLHSSPRDTIQYLLWQSWQPLLQVVPLDTPENRMQTAICHVDLARRDPASPTASECARTALLQAQQYSGTNFTLYATAQPPRWSSKGSPVNSNASHAYLTCPLRLLHTR